MKQESFHSERRREIKHSRKASYFTKAQKIQEGVLSEDDSFESMQIESPPQHIIDPIEHRNQLSDESMIFDDNFVLDTT